MKILQVNKFNYLKGGSEKYFLDLIELLKRDGHQVAKFAMQSPKNLADEHENLFVSEVNFNGGSIWNKLRAAGRIFWSFEAARKFDSLIKEFKPDVIHLHNIYHQLSPSILKVAKKHQVPIVMHLHDYKLLCPNMKMYNSTGICERCRGGKYYNCTAYKCLKDSYLKSLLASLEMYLHHQILKIYERTVDYYIASSEFMADKAIAWGVPAEKLIIQPYFIKTEEYGYDPTPGKYLLYYGRLVKEKGVSTLLRACKELGNDCLPLKIVGDGPELENLKQEIKQLNIGHRVELICPTYGEAMNKLVLDSYAVIVPSEWYEVTGLVNLDAGMMGKPVIASRNGGIQYVIKDQETGLLFYAGSVSSLTESLSRLMKNPKLAEKLGRAAHEYVLANYNGKNHLAGMLGIYQKIINSNSITTS